MENVGFLMMRLKSFVSCLRVQNSKGLYVGNDFHFQIFFSERNKIFLKFINMFLSLEVKIFEHVPNNCDMCDKSTGDFKESVFSLINSFTTKPMKWHVLVWVEALCPSQQLFSHVMTFSWVEPVLSNDNEVSCSRTQHRAPGEIRTLDLAINCWHFNIHQQDK